MQSLSHISVGIPIQALSQMSSFTIMFLKCNLSHQPHDCYSRKLLLHHCMLNTAVSFFHRLTNVVLWNSLFLWAITLPKLLSCRSHPPPPSYHRPAMDGPSPARQFPAGLHVSSSCGLPKHLRSFTSHLLKEIPVDIRLLGVFRPLFKTFF